MSNRKTNADNCTIPFHTLITGSLVGGVATILGNPTGLSNNGRLLTEADAWAHFRIRKLQFRLHQNSAAGAFQAVGYIGGVQDTPPANAVQVMELLPSTGMRPTQTVPTEWVRVPKMDLAGPFPWYKSIAGTVDATEEFPGQIIVAGTTTEVYTVEIRGLLEFKTSVAAGNTPAEVALRKQLHNARVAREKELAQKRILALLGTPSQT